MSYRPHALACLVATGLTFPLLFVLVQDTVFRLFEPE